MRILYIFPHPDDESFGPGRAIARHVREGHEVYLLTLTRGGATKQRHRLGLSVTEMGEVRYREMLAVEKCLRLAGMTVLDLPDSGLKACDPRELEAAVSEHIIAIEPTIVVTYPVHGISGFFDHLVTHAIVKRAWLELRDRGAIFLRRLAFYTLPEEHATSGLHRLTGSPREDIDCRMTVTPADVEACNQALDCYQTYRQTIDQSGVRDHLTTDACFECFGEHYDPPLTNLTQRL